MSTNFIYYFAYGSNLLLDRFSYYIKGGIYLETGKDHKGGCRDKKYHFDSNKPLQHIADDLHLYFGNRSPSWNNQGVAFVETAEGCRVLGRLYKVTEEQFYKIQEQEGNHDNWYGRIIKDNVLGFFNGIPIWTITQDSAYKKSLPPSTLYKEIFIAGLRETGYSENEIAFYLNKVLCIELN